MNPLTWLADRLLLGDGPCLTHQDAKLWAQPTDLRGLGELTALWLEGHIDSQPGYYGPVDVDEDIAPGLTETLVALNRAGFVTNNSQGGHNDAYVQQAWVVGFGDAETYRWLLDAVTGPSGELDDSRFSITALPVRRHWWNPRCPDPMVLDLTRPNVASIYDGVSAEAEAALCGALQITIYDPEPGSNDLWPVLRAAAGAHRSVAA